MLKTFILKAKHLAVNALSANDTRVVFEADVEEVLSYVTIKDVIDYYGIKKLESVLSTFEEQTSESIVPNPNYVKEE